MTGWRWIGLAVVTGAALACQDVVSVPGACPEFCPEAVIDVRDTIRQTDSLRFSFNIVRRNTNVRGVALALHEIPIATDSTKTYADMEPYFQDSTLVATLQVPDTLVKGLVSVTIPPGALRHFKPDTLASAIGLRIVSADPAFVSLGADTANPAARMARFVQVDSTSGSVRVTRSESRNLFFKTFVVDSASQSSPAGLVVGGPNAARAFVKLSVPTWLVDSTVVVRATLLVPPPRPTPGAPGDTFRLRVRALGTDFGPKSPLADTTYAGSTLVPVGGTDTVAVDLTKILLLWRGNSVVPHTVMLQLQPEATSINTFEVPGPGAETQGVVRVTYGLRFRPGR